MTRQRLIPPVCGFPSLVGVFAWGAAAFFGGLVPVALWDWVAGVAGQRLRRARAAPLAGSAEV